MHDLESLEQVARLGCADLASWLRQGALGWGRGASQQERLDAFSPVILFAHLPEEAAGGTLADELISTFDGDTRMPSEAVIVTLERWSIIQDGARGAAILVQVATELAAPRLRDGLDALINKEEWGLAEPDLRLGSVIATAACERLSRRDAEQIGIDARRSRVISAEDAARIMSYICRGRLTRVVELAASLRLYDGGETASNVAASLLLRHDPDEIDLALRPKMDGEAQRRARDWLASSLAGFKPATPSRRPWRIKAPKAPTSVKESLRSIEQRLGSSFPSVRWEDLAARGTASIFDSKEDIDPNLDSTVEANVYNIEARKNARRR